MLAYLSLGPEGDLYINEGNDTEGNLIAHLPALVMVGLNLFDENREIRLDHRFTALRKDAFLDARGQRLCNQRLSRLHGSHRETLFTRTVRRRRLRRRFASSGRVRVTQTVGHPTPGGPPCTPLPTGRNQVTKVTITLTPEQFDTLRAAVEGQQSHHIVMSHNTDLPAAERSAHRQKAATYGYLMEAINK